MFAAGPRDRQGQRHVETTVCPSRALADDGGGAQAAVEWWFDVTPFDPWTGHAGKPEWPHRGSMLEQQARNVAVARLLRSEWAVMLKHRQETRAGAKAKDRR